MSATDSALNALSWDVSTTRDGGALFGCAEIEVGRFHAIVEWQVCGRKFESMWSVTDTEERRVVDFTDGFPAARSIADAKGHALGAMVGMMTGHEAADFLARLAADDYRLGVPFVL
jgi:hypothetical protein